jgi:phosphoenolpyruvate-protein kinase (PTS system EI component)
MRFAGVSVSDGAAAGALYLADVVNGGGATAEQVANAFAAVATERMALAVRLRAAGRSDEADIIEVAALIAADSALMEPAVAAVRAGTDAATAVRQAADAQAAVLAALGNADLADRAGDIRQVGQAVIEELAGGRPAQPPGDFILIRREVAAADLVELAETGLVGAASVTGGASSHAAIVARGLGLPMVTGVDAAVLAIEAGHQAVVDADAGELIIDPPISALAAAVPRPAPTGAGQAAPRTADDFEITILANVASTAETRRGLAGGAAGVGLLRTEIPFTSALSWPTHDEHAAQLTPILDLLGGKPATVRLLDFSGDKIPPFLAGADSGLASLLAHPSAITDQLSAALIAGRATDLAILVPMVSSPAQVDTVRELVGAVAGQLGLRAPGLGIMVELEATAAAAEDFAVAADFFSIGTNDLTGQVLGLDRRDPTASPARGADPRVLSLVGHVVDVARAAGLPVSVCGDAAADPVMLPLLLGLGIRTLSVPAARVDRVRSAVSRLAVADCQSLAGAALRAETAAQVQELVRSGDFS